VKNACHELSWRYGCSRGDRDPCGSGISAACSQVSLLYRKGYFTQMWPMTVTAEERWMDGEDFLQEKRTDKRVTVAAGKFAVALARWRYDDRKRVRGFDVQFIFGRRFASMPNAIAIFPPLVTERSYYRG